MIFASNPTPRKQIWMFTSEMSINPRMRHHLLVNTAQRSLEMQTRKESTSTLTTDEWITWNIEKINMSNIFLFLFNFTALKSLDLICIECNKSFRTNSTYRRHMRDYHTDIDAQVTQGRKHYITIFINIAGVSVWLRDLREILQNQGAVNKPQVSKASWSH